MLTKKREASVQKVDIKLAMSITLIHQNGGMYLTKEGTAWLERITNEVKK